jgi:hypothetical protein|tara:strand:+ start:80 stop:850 length:771 start_codon:yes stop_codon:yes gene_type:complete
MKNNFNSKLFYKTISSKKNKTVDVIDLIIKCKGYNLKNKNLYSGNVWVADKNDISNAFCDDFFKVKNISCRNIFSGTYLKDCNDEIDCLPICITRRKFEPWDKYRVKALNKLILNYKSFQIVYYITFLNKKLTRIAKLEISQTSNDHDHHARRSVADYEHYGTLDVKFFIINNQLSSLNINILSNSILNFFKTSYYNGRVLMHDAFANDVNDEVILNKEFKWKLNSIKKIYKEKFGSHPKNLNIVKRKDLLKYLSK